MLRERREKDLQFNGQQQDQGDAEAWIRWRELKIKLCALFKWGVNQTDARVRKTRTLEDTADSHRLFSFWIIFL